MATNQIYIEDLTTKKNTILKQPPPITENFEGGLFVSDGSGALTDGDLYYRPPSNGIPVNITSIGSGPVTDAANIGGGVGVFDAKVGSVLNFKSLDSLSGTINIVDIASTVVDFEVNEAALTLDNIGGVLSVPKGGTGATTFTSGNFLQGNGVGAITATKAAPAGDVVGTTDAQALTNKTLTDATNDITANALRSATTTVDVAAAAAPTAGQVLTATSGTTAVWQNSGASIIFGTEYHSAEDLTPTITTVEDPTMTIKLSLITAVIPAGTYRIGWSYDWASGSLTRDFVRLITVDSSSESQFRAAPTSAEISGTNPYGITGVPSDQRYHDGGFINQTFGGAASHTINIEFARGSSGFGSDPVGIDQARLELWRIN